MQSMLCNEASPPLRWTMTRLVLSLSCALLYLVLHSHRFTVDVQHADVDPNQMYRLTPDYYVYYYSQRPADPRLPTPLLSWSEYLRLAKVGHPTPQTVMMAQSAASRGDTDAQVFLLNMQASFQNMGMMPLSSYSEQLQQAYAQQQQQQQEMSAYLAANGLNAMGQQDQGLDDAEGLDVEDGEAEEGSALPGDATAGAGVGAGAGAALAGGANGKKVRDHIVTYDMM